MKNINRFLIICTTIVSSFLAIQTKSQTATANLSPLPTGSFCPNAFNQLQFTISTSGISNSFIQLHDAKNLQIISQGVDNNGIFRATLRFDDQWRSTTSVNIRDTRSNPVTINSGNPFVFSFVKSVAQRKVFSVSNT